MSQVGFGYHFLVYLLISKNSDVHIAFQKPPQRSHKWDNIVENKNKPIYLPQLVCAYFMRGM